MKNKIAYDPEFVEGAKSFPGPKLEHVAWILLAEIFVFAALSVGFFFNEIWKYCGLGG